MLPLRQCLHGEDALLRCHQSEELLFKESKTTVGRDSEPPALREVVVTDRHC